MVKENNLENNKANTIGLAIEKIAGALEILDTSSCSRGDNVEQNLSEAIDILRSIANKQMPRWETPEQWEKRTGNPWSDELAVYYRDRGYADVGKTEWSLWRGMLYKDAKKEARDEKPHMSGVTLADYQIACATEAGPPPDDWEPEEGEK
jgi:hypothetical protein